MTMTMTTRRNSNESHIMRFLSIYRNVRATCHAINPLLAKVPISLATKTSALISEELRCMEPRRDEWQVVGFSFAYRCVNYFSFSMNISAEAELIRYCCR